LETHRWQVTPLEVKHVASSFFDDPSIFPAGSANFDHALIMRDIPHDWLEEPARRITAPDNNRHAACMPGPVP
jgi:hypothetical protein